jgi:hypothetical protein
MRPSVRSACAVALCIFPAILFAQQPPPTYQIHRDVIRGRVTSDSGKVVVDATVSITMAPDRQSQFAKSDSAGRYEVVYEKGTGDYLVHIAALGREAFRKRITRTGSDSVFTVDAALKTSVQQLAPVTVQAQRQRIARETGNRFPNSIGGKEDVGGTGVSATVAPDQKGNLDALASAIPGKSVTPRGI